MTAAFLGGILLGVVILLGLVVWSIRRHRDPDLHIECDSPIDALNNALGTRNDHTLSSRYSRWVHTKDREIEVRWQPENHPTLSLSWCGHGQEVLPIPANDGKCDLVPVIGQAG